MLQNPLQLSASRTCLSIRANDFQGAWKLRGELVKACLTLNFESGNSLVQQGAFIMVEEQSRGSWVSRVGLFCVIAMAPPAAQACISDAIEGRGQASQSIVIKSACGQYVSWSMCIRVSDRPYTDTPSGVVSPGGTSQYGVLLNPGTTFDYRMNWCEGAGCTAQQPSC